MQKRHLQGLLTAMLANLLLWNPVAAAGIKFFLNNKAPSEIKIWVGKKNKISTVSFTVDPVELGNGTPIESSNRPIHIQVQIRSTAANPLTGTLTVDSLSDPLKNTASSTTIPFSEISWTADDDDIPSGVYQETINQPLVSFQSSQRVRDRHTFSYANSMVIEAGTYKGSVKYTWAVP